MEVVCLILGPMLASQPCSHAFWVLTSLHLLSFLLKMFFIILHYSAITFIWSTSVLSKKQFDALPDAQIAIFSAKRFVMMTSNQPVINDCGDGIIPVSISVFIIIRNA